MNHEMRIESIEWLKASAVYCICGWADYTHSVAHVTSLYRAHLDTTDEVTA